MAKILTIPVYLSLFFALLFGIACGSDQDDSLEETDSSKKTSLNTNTDVPDSSGTAEAKAKAVIVIDALGNEIEFDGIPDKVATIRPVAGTIGNDPKIDDHELEIKLKSSIKDKAEHIMLVDLARHDVG